MSIELDNKKYVSKLGDSSKSFLQVLLQEFTLSNKNEGLEIEIEIKDGQYCITDTEGKGDLRNAIKENSGKVRLDFIETLRNFNDDKNLLSYHFDCDNFPFRYANGGVLPIVRLDSEEYFSLFYRDIFPVGWNICNGASDDMDELLNPNSVISREFKEELIISNEDEKFIYQFDTLNEDSTINPQRESVEVLNKKFSDRNLEKYKKLPLPIKWIQGPDCISVLKGNKRYNSDGYFLNITPDDNAIELDRIAILNLKGNISLFDGEISHGIAFNRIVGLFKTKGFEQKLKKNKFIPDRIFFNGKEQKDKKKINTIINSGYLPAIDSIRTEEEKSYYKTIKTKNKEFNLCPITSAIIGRYFSWINNEIQMNGKDNEMKKEDPPNENANYQVFISYKSDDYQIASRLNQYLTTKGYSVFFSGESIMRLGTSDYAKAIDIALESSRCLVVIGSNPEFFNSGWVGYEWRSFLNEILSERKIQGKLFTFTFTVKIEDLPYALRSVQNIPYSPHSPLDSFEILTKYIEATIK